MFLGCAVLLAVPGRAYPQVREVPPAAAEAGPEVCGGFTVVPLQGAEYDYADGVLTFSAGDAAVCGGGEGERIVLAGDVHLTLLGVDIRARSGAGITVTPGVNAVLLLGEGSVNSVAGDDNYAGVQVSMAEKGLPSLSIDGAGALTARGGRNSAGIGGSYYGGVFYGDIYINGGTVTALGGSNAAGIGSAVNSLGVRAGYKMDEDQWGSITISGGAVTARGDGSGAGIGGGNHADSGEILIRGGTVDAQGASGIGSGVGSARPDRNGEKGPGYYFGQITISGGTVTAVGRSNGAGIGGAMFADAVVTISGGTVTAAGSGGSRYYHGAAGIGGGFEGHARITISGGTVTAAGGGGGAGIGSGSAANADGDRSESRCGTPALESTRVKIAGGDITAAGGDRGGAGVGGGAGADRADVTVSGGSVTASGGAGSRTSPRGGAGIGSGCGELVDGKTLRTSSYLVSTKTSVTVSGGSVTAAGGWGAAGIGGGADNAPASSLSLSADADVTAFSDGVRFALDTREGGAEDTRSRTKGRDIAGVLQGTFVDLYTDHGRTDYEGLTLTLVGEGWGEVLALPEGYRSFARSVPDGAGESVSVRAGGEIFAPGAGERAVPEDFSGGHRFPVSPEGFTDVFFLSPATSVRAALVWDDRDDLDESRPDAVLRLLQNGAELRSAAFPRTPDDPDAALAAVWDDLPRYAPDGAAELDYTVALDAAPGYEVRVTGGDGDFTVTAVHVPEVTDIAGTIRWAGLPNPSPPERIAVVLWAGDREYRRCEVAGGPDGWEYAFGEVPLTLGGAAADYTVTIEGAPGYLREPDGWDFRLVFIPEHNEESKSR